MLLLPLLHRSRPLSRDVLRDRLERLSARAGVPVLDVHELPLGERSRRASAALVGAGSTRRILLSDTLLANYSDDEIEVVMAHEMGHHVHRHTMKAMAVEVLLLFAGFRLAASVLEASWRWLGLSSAADVAGLPVVILSVAGVMLLATPLLNAWSRAHERRADRFALKTASEPAAFIGAVRRMAAHNLAEEHPSSAAFLLFHTHPTAEERIAAAREVLRESRAFRLKPEAHAGTTANCGFAASAGTVWLAVRLPNDQRAFHVPAAFVLLEIAVELEGPRLVGAELEGDGLAGAGALGDAVALVVEAVRHVDRGEGDLHQVVAVHFDAGGGVVVIAPGDGELAGLALFTG